MLHRLQTFYRNGYYRIDMEAKKLRKDHMICLLNNSASGIDEEMKDISEINELY